ncbi:hypothetical protein HYN43_019470 [Mucilaginibacter celer]|uniref:Uncharacterized protein n=1 Tax=Mucilaginibacter celer TaxID=2305508 RepID=A0A494W1G9_9SPHI|nr:hypothetical protein HYN43_019470 [Mucilaginibacter celer]
MHGVVRAAFVAFGIFNFAYNIVSTCNNIIVMGQVIVLIKANWVGLLIKINVTNGGNVVLVHGKIRLRFACKNTNIFSNLTMVTNF